MKKQVILTGGTRGIGLAILQCLDKLSSYNIHVISKNLETIENTKKQFPNVSFYQVDLAVPNEIKNFATSINKMEIFAIINNAGICKTAKLGEDNNTFNDILNVNLLAPFQLTEELSGLLQDNGRIINISSQLGKEGRAGYGAYCASKFAIIGLTKCWAKELGRRGITANAICPGWVDTEMSQIDMARIAKEKGVTAEEYIKIISEPLELKRFTTPTEVGNLVEFLLSEKASGITGRDWLLNTIWNQE